jgi:transposase
MYSEINQLKATGLNKSQTARHLGINVKTVNKYWNVAADEFAETKQKSGSRKKKLKHYEENVLRWLQQFPEISAAQVMDWLKERCHAKKVRERTVRRMVARLRQEHHIEKQPAARQYQAVEDPPMGKQLQVDFGEKTVRRASGGHCKLYTMGAVLSHSRYKYGEWSDKPLTTTTFIQMLRRCFDYLGGVPEELVFDQDKLLATSENHGDVLYTYEFEKFKQTMGFEVWLCRKNDPESKGRIEAVVKYMKRGFAANRLFTDIKTWNLCFEDWLERTGNRKVHGTTKKVPAEVFLVEKQYLRPAPLTKITPDDIVTIGVRKDNTIWYKSNRYTVPIGTYKPDLSLELRVDDSFLTLFDMTGAIVASHEISPEKGKLVRNNNHLRDNSQSIDDLYEKVLGLLGNSEDAAVFLKALRHEKPRYARDQFKLMEDAAGKYPAAIVGQAISYCLNLNLFSAVECRDAAIYLLGQTVEDAHVTPAIENTSVWPAYLRVRAEHRSITAYTELLGGDAR